eukprot:CAMPEP_0119130958 /NCGR_PEP_ID=MMETSP1310-20130426/9090_1 /TAXON_ID=464262 /ORGANISM="Genus nov. species nov., Strain RCC2339" /LENGTH=75 /DNA_ID=CAMNT_0007121503 /DNA_START=40 /DNA_END=267 /DNA_ORIENTATION=-
MAQKEGDKSKSIMPFEEDDEFEEFEGEWNAKDEEVADKREWEEDWDDDEHDERFSTLLREEIEKVKAANAEAMKD